MQLLEVALSQYGVKEMLGEKHNPVILSYSNQVGLNWVQDDETPWCSIFMNWCAMKAGLVRSGKANARSWLDVGTLITSPQIGDVVVLKRGNSEWQGHVGLFINKTSNNTIHVLGGNQGDMVKISEYNVADVLGYRRL